MPLPDRIRTARRRARLSQARLAVRLGVDRSAVSHWEHSHGNLPSSVNLLALAEITGVRLEWLAQGKGAMLPSNGAGTENHVPIHEDYVRDEEEEYWLRGYRLLSATARRVLRARLERLLRKSDPAH